MTYQGRNHARGALYGDWYTPRPYTTRQRVHELITGHDAAHCHCWRHYRAPLWWTMGRTVGLVGLAGYFAWRVIAWAVSQPWGNRIPGITE